MKKRKSFKRFGITQHMVKSGGITLIKIKIQYYVFNSKNGLNRI